MCQLYKSTAEGSGLLRLVDEMLRFDENRELRIGIIVGEKWTEKSSLNISVLF